MTLVLLGLAGYALGSLPWGYWLTRRITGSAAQAGAHPAQPPLTSGGRPPRVPGFGGRLRRLLG
jgi:hypothetical protein